MARSKLYLFKMRGNMKSYIVKPSYVLMKQGVCQRLYRGGVAVKQQSGMRKTYNPRMQNSEIRSLSETEVLYLHYKVHRNNMLHSTTYSSSRMQQCFFKESHL